MNLYESVHAPLVLDICYARHDANVKRLASAFAPYHPRPRDLPENLPFVWDEQTLQSGTNFTFNTDLGEVDLLSEVAGVGTYEDALVVSLVVTLYGLEYRVLTLDSLIAAKRAAGRPKDLLVLPELEALREVSEKPLG